VGSAQRRGLERRHGNLEQWPCKALGDLTSDGRLSTNSINEQLELTVSHMCTAFDGAARSGRPSKLPFECLSRLFHTSLCPLNRQDAGQGQVSMAFGLCAEAYITPAPPEALIWSSDMATMVFMVRYGIWGERERRYEEEETKFKCRR
jgi:hypothetical protein